jgi:TetR/AcrR family transcriptional regulator, transcriptional repressor for nem operon
LHTKRSVFNMEDSRNYILQTAFKLFLEKSYKAVTFQELMEKTGFSKGAFFHYFKNKQEIFEAVIDLYVAQFATVDFTRLSQTNLRNFLDNYFAEVKKLRGGLSDQDTVASANQYALLFEAMRIIPDFKSKLIKQEDKVLAGWLKLIAAAREGKEITTVLSDLQIARLFIDTGHGIVLHLIMTDNLPAIETEASAAWNNIYLLIKT